MLQHALQLQTKGRLAALQVRGRVRVRVRVRDRADPVARAVVVHHVRLQSGAHVATGEGPLERVLAATRARVPWCGLGVGLGSGWGSELLALILAF